MESRASKTQGLTPQLRTRRGLGFLLRAGPYLGHQHTVLDLLTTKSFCSQQKPTYTGSSLESWVN